MGTVRPFKTRNTSVQSKSVTRRELVGNCSAGTEIEKKKVLHQLSLEACSNPIMTRISISLLVTHWTLSPYVIALTLHLCFEGVLSS